MTVNIHYKFAADRIQTADLWCWKQPLYQLSHTADQFFVTLPQLSWLLVSYLINVCQQKRFLSLDSISFDFRALSSVCWMRHLTRPGSARICWPAGTAAAGPSSSVLASVLNSESETSRWSGWRRSKISRTSSRWWNKSCHKNDFITNRVVVAGNDHSTCALEISIFSLELTFVIKTN